MLRKLLIKNFILIDDININFQEGLTVLSGETGAGKSILLDAIKLLLSKKTATNIKKQADKTTIVELVFDNPNTQDKKIQTLLEENSIEIDEDMLILRKSISKDNRVSASINDFNVSIKLLSTLLSALLEIHGQHDNNDLFDSSKHIKYLDSTLKEHGPLLSKLKSKYNEYKIAKRDYEELKAKKDQYLTDIKNLKDTINDIEKLSPTDGEFNKLVDQQILLKKGQNLKQLYQKYQNQITSPNGIQTGLLLLQKDLINNLSNDEESFSYLLNEVEQMLKSCDSIVDKLELQNYSNEYSLDEIEERISHYKSLSRKYSINAVEICDFYQSSISQLDEISTKLEKFQNLDKNINILKEQFLTMSEQVNSIRQKAASDLEETIHHNLKDLYMEKTKFKIQFYNLSEENWSHKGNKKVTFEVSTNPGQPYGELTKIASGGELSRFMLSLKIALTLDSKTLIFDEIDTGISGKVSESVGTKLSHLSNNNQVIIITHQPQVAAKSNNHLKIIKSYNSNITNIEVTPLSIDEKIEEIARMISGKEITDKARQAAKQIING